MQSIILTVLLAIFSAILLPPVWDRLMSSAPPYAWNILFFATVVVGVSLAVLSTPVYPRLRNAGQYPISATLIGATALALVGASAMWFLLLPWMPRTETRQLGFGALGAVSEYRPGTVRNGIAWSPRFGELRIMVSNATSKPIEDLHLLVKPDEPVVAVAQETAIPGVTITVTGEPTVNMELVNQQTGHRQAIPVSLRATTAGYRVICPRLNAKGNLTLLLAIAGVIDKVKSNSSKLIDERYVLTLSMSDGSKTFYGFPTELIFEPTRRTAGTVHIEAEFSIDGERKTVTDDVKVLDMVADALRQGIPPHQ